MRAPLNINNGGQQDGGVTQPAVSSRFPFTDHSVSDCAGSGSGGTARCSGGGNMGDGNGSLSGGSGLDWKHRTGHALTPLTHTGTRLFLISPPP